MLHRVELGSERDHTLFRSLTHFYDKSGLFTHHWSVEEELIIVKSDPGQQKRANFKVFPIQSGKHNMVDE